MGSSENTEETKAEAPDTEREQTAEAQENGAFGQENAVPGQEGGVKATTKVGPKDMYRFQLYHTYVGVTGLLLGLLAILALADLIGNFSSMNTGTKAICVLLILWAVVINPVNLYFKSKRQVETAELFQNPIDLEVTKEGITLTQGENGGTIAWKEVTKIVILKKLVIFYMGKVRAHLLPLDQIPEEQADAVEEAILADASGVKIVNRRKKRRK